MTDQTTEAILTRLAQAEARLAVAERELAARHPTTRRGRTPRRPGHPRVAGALAVALLLALVPLALLAAGPFNDVPPGPHSDDIASIAAAGITKGCDPPDYRNYCPGEAVTRDQMASFIARAAGLGGNKPVANAARLAVANPIAGGPTFAANELVRLHGAKSTSVVALQQDTYNNYVNANVNVPGQGVILATGEILLRSDSTTEATQVEIVLLDTNGGNASATMLATLPPKTDTVDSWVTVPVTFFTQVNPGNHPIALQARKRTPAGAVSATAGNLVVLYTPFGQNGVIGGEKLP